MPVSSSQPSSGRVARFVPALALGYLDASDRHTQISRWGATLAWVLRLLPALAVYGFVVVQRLMS